MDCFFNCDWGTTHFRLRLCTRHDVRPLASFESDAGVAVLARQRSAGDGIGPFAKVLTAAMGHLLAEGPRDSGSAPVLISGMAGSSIGWHELPYAVLPLHIDGSDLIQQELNPVSSDRGRHRVWLISGARTDDDVMRGEEMQAVGLFQLPAARPHIARALVIMPGTHSKHLQVDEGQITSFQTFMTGELFDVIGRHSILQHSIGTTPADPPEPAAELESFQQGVTAAGRQPLLAALFQVRTRQLLDARPPAANRAYLSGLLIGGELAYLADEAFRDRPILLCAPAPIDTLYSAALSQLGLAERVVVVKPADVDRLSALGQARLLDRLPDA